MRTGLHTLALGLVLVVALAAGTTIAAAASSLDVDERATLVAMREEEKLSHDVYVALAAKTGEKAFLRIAAAEERHGLAMERMLTLYGIADPTDGYVAGKFPTASIQKLYDDFVAKGSASRTAAIGVGLEIERTDVADLKAAIAQTDEAVLDRAYANLLAGSERHLKAFQENLTCTGTAAFWRADAGRRAHSAAHGRGLGAFRGAGLRASA